MSFISKLNFNPLTVSQEPQPEITTQAPASPPVSQSEAPTSLGVAGSPDQFETAGQNQFDLMQQQSQSAMSIQPSTTRELTVDASSVFSFLEPSVAQLDNRLPQLNDQLNSLEIKKRELTTKMEQALDEKKEINKAMHDVQRAINSDQPFPAALLATLGSLGVLGIVGGLPVIPVITGAIGAFLGLSPDYKEKAKEVQAQLERNAGEKDRSWKILKHYLFSRKVKQKWQNNLIKDYQ